MKHKSYVEFEAYGAYCDEYVDYLISASGAEVFNVSSNKGLYTLRTRPTSYLQAARAAAAYGVRTRVKKRSGLYFKLRGYRDRLGIPLGLVGFFAVVTILSGYVWDIHIEGNTTLTQRQILVELDKHGIAPGAKIRSYDTSMAELDLATTFDEIAWVSIERTGSRILVKMSESIPLELPEIPHKTPCNVVAGRSGKLVSAEVFSGRLVVQEGSYVKAGDVIVSGVMGGLEEDGTVSPWYYTHSEARLTVESTETHDFFQPFKTTERAANGYSAENAAVAFLGKRFALPWGQVRIDPNADHVDYSETVVSPALFGFRLPWRVVRESYTFHDSVEVTDTAEVTLDKLNNQVALYEENFLSDAVVIERWSEYFHDANGEGIGCLVRYVYRVEVGEKRELER